MHPRVFGVVVLLAGILACRHDPARAPALHATKRAVPAGGARPRPSTNAPIVAEYAVRYDGRSDLHVEGTLEGSRVLTVESGAERFVDDLEVAADAPAPKWERPRRDGGAFVAPSCSARCRIRYRFRLRDAAKRLDDLEIASEEGEVLEAPPSTWLVAPANDDPQARVRFRVTATGTTTFQTGVFRSPDAGAWDIALGDLWTSPYSVFGPLRVRTIATPAPARGGAREPGRIDVAIAPGKLTVSDDELAAWVEGAARAIVTYFGRFPMSQALVILVPSRGRSVGGGKTLSGGGGAVFMRVGEHTPLRALREDWVLVHEMTHLAFPSVAREHDWAEEGLATYAEPFARARAGLMSAEEAWLGLMDGLPNGLPAAGDRGLDRTPTWGRTYWGGALFYLLADVEIRKRTKNAKGLEHALRGILAEGGNNAHRWSLDDAFAAGDRATGVPVLEELHRAMGTSPHPVDLDAYWKELGVVKSRGAVRFVDAAPLAAIRRSITTSD